MYQDYKDLLSAFHAHGVKYLIVGTSSISVRVNVKCVATFVERTRSSSAAANPSA